MRVEQLMTKQVKSCSPGDTLERAAQLMWDGDCGCLPVCAGNGVNRVVGVITDRDICMAALFQGKPLRELPVSGAMAQQLLACKAGDAVSDVENTLREARIRRLPVIDEQGALIGIIALADLAREAARERTAARRDITESEVGDTLAAICQSSTSQGLAA
jgi:CBS-domain-containing membrane protein